MSTSFTSDAPTDQDNDERNNHAQLLADLQLSLQQAEIAANDYRQQVEELQRRLEASMNDQTEAEERLFHGQTQIDRMQVEIKEAARQKREMVVTLESEKRLLLQDKERGEKKQKELQGTIGRLNETLRVKGLERATNSRAGELRDRRLGEADSVTASMPMPAHEQQLADSSQAEDIDPHTRALQEKDAEIEGLRIEVAEFHLDAAQNAHLGDSHIQHLEHQLTEIKMQNARLQEENESFQMLLSEKTLKGDFMTESRHLDDTKGMSTLAEELEIAADDPETNTESYKKLEAELRSAKEENKGLALYIDKIIGRILQHDGLEHIIVNASKDGKEMPPPPPSKPRPLEKALPPPPGEDIATPTSAVSMSSAATGFLKRAGSMMSRSGTGRPARPMSMAQPPPVTPTANENPQTAPSIPINRGHRRARSDQAQQDLGAAAVVHQMNRGSPLRTVSGGPMSPGRSPLSPSLQPQTGYFPNPMPASTARGPSADGRATGHSSRNSITSDHSLDRDRSSTEGRSTEASSIMPSNPHRTGSEAGMSNAMPAAVMKQGQLRPLRLVQEKSREEEEMQKRANRGSWIGWFKGSAVEANQEVER